MSGDEAKKKDAVNGKSEKQLEVLMWGYFPGVTAQRSPLNSPVSVRFPETEAVGDSWKDVCAGGCGFGMALFDFDKEDELLRLEKGWDEVDKSGEGFKSVRERILKDRVANGDENFSDEDESDEPEEGNWKRKRKPSQVEKGVMEQFLEVYYKLDYEDTIGDLKTRFKYKPVKPKRYGLATEEVLTLDDKELNQYVSLKKLAPYREKEWKVPRIKTIQLKKSKQYLMGNTSRPVNEERGRQKRRRLMWLKVKDHNP
ncbi:hypothetical protein C2S52_020579 [Perilla frutescens var. hirtella]|nr:hypothetical protein C2S52_020579 [Perilla frutescens var. hirtella]